MKKVILSIFIVMGCFSGAVNAQEIVSAAATLQPDGSQIIHRTDATGKITTLTLPKGASMSGIISSSNIPVSKSSPVEVSGSHPWISHQAVLAADGTQEIHLRDALGKEMVISARKGESVQQKYWDYLRANNLPCACGSGPVLSDPSVKTATRTASLGGTEQNTVKK